MRAIGKQPGLSRCIVMSCTERDRIIHTGIAMKEKIEDLLHKKVCSEPKHLQTSLCVNHYKQIHRLLYCNEAMYTDKRCCTCHTLIRYCATARHCPNPAAVNMYFSMNGDTDINITEKDYVCSSCYNHHLVIAQRADLLSTDVELEQVLSSQSSPAPWAETKTHTLQRHYREQSRDWAMC